MLIEIVTWCKFNNVFVYSYKVEKIMMYHFNKSWYLHDIVHGLIIMMLTLSCHGLKLDIHKTHYRKK